MHSAPQQKWQGLAVPLPVAFVEMVSVPSPFPHISHVPSDHIVWRYLIEHSRSILHAPTLHIHITKQFPIKTSESQPLSTICSSAHLPSSSAAILVHAFSTPTNMTDSGSTPSCCICWKSSSAFCPCPHFTCPNIITFQMTTSCEGIWLNTLCKHLPCSHSLHMHWAPPLKGQDLAAPLPAAFVEIVPVPSALAHISQVLISLHSKWLHHTKASYWTPCKHSPCSYILHTCQPGYYPNRHLSPTCCEWSAHEQTCPLQVQLHLHMHSTLQLKWQGLAAHVPAAFVQIVPMPYALAHISHVLISLYSRIPHFLMASCWTLSQHLPCFHILHTCPPGYSPQKHLIHISFEWSVHEHIYLLWLQLHWHMHSAPPQKRQGLAAHLLPVAFVEIVPVPCPCPLFTCPNIIAFQVTTPREDMWVNTLQASSMHPHLAYMSTSLLPTKTLASQPLATICACTRLPRCSAPKLAHELSTWTKVKRLGGLVPFCCCMCWKSSNVFSCCPILTYLASFLFHEKVSNCTVPGAIGASSATTHDGFRLSTSQSASPIFLCLKSGSLGFTFSDLPSHHCEGSEKNSCQRVPLLLAAALAPTSPPEEEEKEEEEASALWPLPLVIRPKQQQQQHCDSRASPWRTAIANKNRRKIPNWETLGLHGNCPQDMQIAVGVFVQTSSSFT